MSADLDPRDLNEVRRRVVEPVVASLIGPDEVSDVHVYADNDEVYVRVVAREELVTWCLLGTLGSEPWDAHEMADRFYGLITDDLPATRFAWGEQREGRYQVPGPLGASEPPFGSQ